MKIQNIIVGAGIVGIITAERLASRGESVLIVEKRDHIGGNCYDYFDYDGCYIQKYGPHIFHTNDKKVWDYLSKFTEWHFYEHRVLADINSNLIPLPFNLNSVELSFPNVLSIKIEEKLINRYGFGSRVSIFQLLNEKDELLKKLADYVYNNVFLNYNLKQWDLNPKDIDRSVLDRVPIVVSKDNRYFNDKFQGIPKMGYTVMFKRMLKNKKIMVLLNTDYKDIIDSIEYEKMYYTGYLDYFFNYKFGKIKYRAIDFKFEKVNNPYQNSSVINYPNNYNFTRITEFNKFLNISTKYSVICKEFPSWNNGIKAYPVQNTENKKIVEQYINESKKISNVFFIGRLSECKYYNMDEAIRRVLKLIG